MAALAVPFDAETSTALHTLAETPEAYWSYRGQLAWN